MDQHPSVGSVSRLPRRARLVVGRRAEEGRTAPPTACLGMFTLMKRQQQQQQQHKFSLLLLLTFFSQCANEMQFDCDMAGIQQCCESKSSDVPSAGTRSGRRSGRV